MTCRIADLKPGQQALITAVDHDNPDAESLRRLGILEGSRVDVLMRHGRSMMLLRCGATRVALRQRILHAVTGAMDVTHLSNCPAP